MKICSKCNIEKELEAFRTRPNGKRRNECRTCQKEYYKTYYENNKVKFIEKSRAWRANNPERYKEQNKRLYELRDKEAERKRLREYARQPVVRKHRNVTRKEWRQRDYVKLQEKEYSRLYAKRFPERARNAARKRRALKACAEGEFTIKEFKDLCSRYNNMCLSCRKIKVTLHADHVIPLSKGGSNAIDNIQPLCKSCNSSKGTDTTDYRVVREVA